MLVDNHVYLAARSDFPRLHQRKHCVERMLYVMRYGCFRPGNQWQRWLPTNATTAFVSSEAMWTKRQAFGKSRYVKGYMLHPTTSPVRSRQFNILTSIYSVDVFPDFKGDGSGTIFEGMPLQFTSKQVGIIGTEHTGWSGKFNILLITIPNKTRNDYW